MRHEPSLDTRYPAEWPARVTVHAGDREETREVSAPPGHPSRPLSFADTADRFRDYAAEYLNADACDTVVDLVDGLREAPDVRELVAPLCQSEPPSIA